MKRSTILIMILMMTIRFVLAQQSGNLVQNGSFENGSAGIKSDFSFSSNSLSGGKYAVTDHVRESYGDAFVNPESSTGLYLAVDANDTGKRRCWYDSITIKPNTVYSFSCMVANMHANYENPPVLKLNVNGKKVSKIINLPYNNKWRTLSGKFTSGPDQTRIEISIQDMIWVTTGNDVAIDNIVFKEVEPEAPPVVKETPPAVAINTEPVKETPPVVPPAPEPPAVIPPKPEPPVEVPPTPEPPVETPPKPKPPVEASPKPKPPVAVPPKPKPPVEASPKPKPPVVVPPKPKPPVEVPPKPKPPVVVPPKPKPPVVVPPKPKPPVVIPPKPKPPVVPPKPKPPVEIPPKPKPPVEVPPKPPVVIAPAPKPVKKDTTPEIVAVSADFKKDISLDKIKVDQKLQLRHIYFERAKFNLLMTSMPELNDLAAFMKKYPTVRIRLEGHTDNQGDPKLNVELSENRVKEVKKYLVEKGIEDHRIEWIGYGGQKALNSNSNEYLRQQNRRVEAVIINK